MAIAFSIAPIFFLIVLGYALRRGGFPTAEFWNFNDKLAYWILVPALLFHKTATMPIGGETFFHLAGVIYPAFFGVVTFALLAGYLFCSNRPLWTSLFQGCVRHNSFIALAVADQLFGYDGLVIASLIVALLIPITNVVVVTTLVVLLRDKSRGSLGPAIMRDLARNPLILAVAFGLSLNYSPVAHIPVVYDMAKILGGAALPIMLLCVGANIRVRSMALDIWPTVLTVMGKMIVFPILIGFLAVAWGFDGIELMVLIVFGAVPTATSGYNLAKEMGGDAPTMAAMITLQTLLSMATLPLTLMATTWLRPTIQVLWQ